MNTRPVLPLVVLSLLVTPSCDLFQTRDPQPPTQSTSGYKPPDTPDILLDNFISAVEQHNVENYMRCLVDTTASTHTYSFTPSGDFQGVFRSWRLEDEERYFQNLGAPVNGVPVLTFTNLQQLNSSSSTTEYTMDYDLFYPHQRTDLTQEVKGYMHLYLALDNQRRWSIYRWDDTRTVTDSTWSYFKAHF